MYQPEDILEGARSIRPYLRSLLASDADMIDREVADLLGRAQAGEKVGNLLLDVLSRNDATREWMAQFLKNHQLQYREETDTSSKSFEPPAGEVSALEMPIFRCPQCDYEWRRPFVGMPIRECPVHHISLVQIK